MPNLTKISSLALEVVPDHDCAKIDPEGEVDQRSDAGSATEILLASSRDAMAWNRPNTRSRKRVHVAINLVDLPACGDVPALQLGEAACDPGRMPLDMSVASPAEEFPEERRCRRPGCASRWPMYKPGSRS